MSAAQSNDNPALARAYERCRAIKKDDREGVHAVVCKLAASGRNPESPEVQEFLQIISDRSGFTLESVQAGYENECTEVQSNVVQLDPKRNKLPGPPCYEELDEIEAALAKVNRDDPPGAEYTAECIGASAASEAMKERWCKDINARSGVGIMILKRAMKRGARAMEDWNERQGLAGGSGDRSGQSFAAFDDCIYIGEKGGVIAYPSGDGTYDFWTENAFVGLHSDMGLISVDGEAAPVAKAWMKKTKSRCAKMGFWPHPHPREYIADDVLAPAFLPLPNDRRALNMFQGLAYDPKPGNVKLAKHMVRYVLADGDEDRAHYIWAWLAYNVQHMGDLRSRLPVWLVFTGPQGAGKSSFWEAVCALFARHGIVISKGDHLTGRFNALLAECVFLLCEEAIYSRDPRIKGPLKHTITGKKQTLERKGIDAVPVDNYTFGVMCSNEDDAVPMEDGERRFAIFNVSERYMKRADDGTKETARHNARCRRFWTGWRAWADNADNLGALLHALLTFKPADGWAFLHDVPSTKEGHEASARAMPPAYKLVCAMVHAGVLPDQFGELTSDPKNKFAQPIPLEGFHTAGEIADGGAAWAKANCDAWELRDRPVTARAIGAALSKMLPGLPVEPDPRGKTTGRTFPDPTTVANMLRRNPTYAAALDVLARQG